MAAVRYRVDTGRSRLDPGGPPQHQRHAQRRLIPDVFLEAAMLAQEIAVIGGAEIYAQWMDDADRLEITEVHARPEGDTRFAAIDAAIWGEVARVRHPAGPDDSADYSYVTYRRRKSN